MPLLKECGPSRAALAFWAEVLPPEASGEYREILERGEQFKYAPVPERYARWTGKRGECFLNAFFLAAENPELDYVEGFASIYMPVHHAWCADKDGNVIDPTWVTVGKNEDPTQRDYLGVRVPLRDVAQRMADWGTYGYYLKGPVPKRGKRKKKVMLSMLNDVLDMRDKLLARKNPETE